MALANAATDTAAFKIEAIREACMLDRALGGRETTKGSFLLKGMARKSLAYTPQLGAAAARRAEALACRRAASEEQQLRETCGDFHSAALIGRAPPPAVECGSWNPPRFFLFTPPRRRRGELCGFCSIRGVRPRLLLFDHTPNLCAYLAVKTFECSPAGNG
jgi:hypothetical protein